MLFRSRVVRLAPDELSIVDESAMKTLFGHGTTSIKGDWYRAWQAPDSAPNIFATQDLKAHDGNRRRIAPAYKMTSILKLEKYMQLCFDNLWQKLRGQAEQEKAVDMCHWTNALAFDVIGELCYGEPLGLIDGKNTMDIHHTLYTNHIVSNVLGHVWGQLMWVANPLTRLLKVENPFMLVVDWSSKKVFEHLEKEDSDNHRDMMDYFIEYRDSKGNKPSHDDIADNSLASM